MIHIATEIDISWATFIHFMFGVYAAILPGVIGLLLGSPIAMMIGVVGVIMAFTWYFKVKQFLDWRTGEESDRTSGDLAEYAAGVVVGLHIIILIIIY